jgi:hypothetical protein
MSPVKYELGFYMPEDDILRSHRRENVKSYRLYISLCWASCTSCQILNTWAVFFLPVTSYITCLNNFFTTLKVLQKLHSSALTGQI